VNTGGGLLRTSIACLIEIGVYKISCTSSRLCTNPSSFHSSSPPAFRTLLHDYCAIYDPPSTSPLYALHHAMYIYIYIHIYMNIYIYIYVYICICISM